MIEPEESEHNKPNGEIMEQVEGAVELNYSQYDPKGDNVASKFKMKLIGSSVCHKTDG